MINHLLLASVDLNTEVLHKEYVPYLKQWREKLIDDIDMERVSSSLCLQGAFVDLVLDGRLTFDWLSVMKDFLSKDGVPLAYSENYGKQLYKFEAQYFQSPIHAIHARWWIEKLTYPNDMDEDFFSNLILKKQQSDGLFYDKDISETIFRHRMKSELLMSAMMSAEILIHAGKLDEKAKRELATNLTEAKLIPIHEYISTEQYRLQTLKFLDFEEWFPVNVEKLIIECSDGLEYGWNDFVMSSKVDAYMGTKKRIMRDNAIHSPLIATYVDALCTQISSLDDLEWVQVRLNTYVHQLALNPLKIPAFQMRDITIPFGADITPIEAISASGLIKKFM